MGITAFYGAPLDEAAGVALLKDVLAEGAAAPSFPWPVVITRLQAVAL